ncbi:MAG: hypothetical protein WCF40_08990 [Desulfobacterales bacterium]
MATETSIGKCFIAGVIPGILLVFLSSLWVGLVFFYRKLVPPKKGSLHYIKDQVTDEHCSWKERFVSLFKVLPFVLIIIGIMGSLYGGTAAASHYSGVGF